MIRKRRRSWLSAAAAVTAATLLLAGCAGGGTTPTESGGQTVNFAAGTAPNNLDPAAMSDGSSTLFVTQVYDPLLRYDAEKDEYVPYLAETWDVADDATQYTFHLRDGVTFHDGSALSAAGVVTAVERMIAVGKGYSYLLGGVADVTASGDLDVVFTLKAPDAMFLTKLGMVYIPSAKAIEQNAGSDNGETWFASNEAGSGPYVMADYTPNNTTVLEKYDDYWRGWDGKHVDTYVIRQADANTQMLGLRQGTFDVADSVSLQDLKSIKDSDGLDVYADKGNPMYVVYNMASEKLQDIRIRQAISLAVPYKDIIDQILLGYANPLNAPTPDWMIGTVEGLDTQVTDLDKAAKLIADAGYSPSKPLELSLVFYSGLPWEETIGTVIQDKLAPLGINISVQGQDWPTLVETVSNPDTRPDLGVVGMSAPTADVGPTLSGTFDPDNAGSWTYWGYSDQETIDLLRAAGQKTSIDELTAAYQEVEQRLVDDYASVWLVEYPAMLVSDSALKNVIQYYPTPSFEFYSAYLG